MTLNDDHPAIRTPRFKPLIVAIVCVGVVALVSLHAQIIAGAWFWGWPFRTLSFSRIYGSFALIGLLFLGARLIARKNVWIALLMLMASCMALKIASILFRPDVTGIDTPSLQLIDIIVFNKDATSYFTDANAVANFPLRDWIEIYPQLSPQMNLHTVSKPPGPVMYWYFWIRGFDHDSMKAARVGGIALGAIATLSIPATFLFLRTLLRDRSAAFEGASFLSLAPGFVLFFPMLDPTFILLSTGIIGFWYKALRDESMKFACASGIMLGFTTLITFNILVIGAFMAGLILIMPGSPLSRFYRGIRQGSILLAGAFGTLLLMQLMLHYDVIATFKSAYANQSALLARYAHNRLYPQTILFDLTDFALGSGWISYVLVIYYFASRPWRSNERGEIETFRLSILAIVQLLIVAITGLLQLETARVWNFMLPLLLIPISAELARWDRQSRAVVYAALLLTTAAICQHVKFIY